ncbi:MAG: universal stress protein [Polyangiaceae bacterium]|nr:universal stress protein [Polyangiaceae bacterium]
MNTVPQILVPTDFSAGAEVALDEALRLAQLIRADVVLLHVLAPYVNAPSHFFLQEAGSRNARLAADIARDHARFRLKKLAERVQAVTSKTPQTRVEFGTPDELIGTLAEEGGYRFIVLGTHGASDTPETLGSVAERVLTRAPCPVLVVPQAAAPALLTVAAASVF